MSYEDDLHAVTQEDFRVITAARGLNVGQRLFLFFLSASASLETRRWRRSLKGLAADLGTTLAQAIRIVDSLKEAGWIVVEPHADGETSIYRMTPVRRVGSKRAERSKAPTRFYRHKWRGKGTARQ